MNIKNFTSCVFACSGPSLNKLDPFSLGLPVVVISTAIRKITNPHYWAYSDYINEMHGPEGKSAFANENINKIMQSGKEKGSFGVIGKNLTTYECELTNRHYDIENVFTPGKPFSKGPHKSITFAIQWAHSMGIKNIIFCGNDLHANSMDEKYCYPVQSFDVKKKHNFKKTLDEVKEYMTEWYPKAKAKGYRWLSWECGSVFEGMVEKLTPEIIAELGNKEEITPINTIDNGQHIETKQPEENVEIINPEIMEYHELMKMIKKF